jgi:surface protein
MEKCQIYFKNKNIGFKPVYIFEKPGFYEIKIQFKEPMKNAYMMFASCKTLKIVDGMKFDASQLEYTVNMFASCYKLEEINISNWNVSNVESMESMFESCTSLKEFIAPNWNTTKARHMNYMFKGCRSLRHLDIRNWKMQNVTKMDDMFCDCESLIELDVSKWEIKNISSINRLFLNCRMLEKLDISNWNTENIDTNYVKMFSNLNKNCEIIYNGDSRLRREREKKYIEAKDNDINDIQYKGFVRLLYDEMMNKNGLKYS